MIGGVTDIRDSAKELDEFVTKVLNATGANSVEFIGHSEGTVVAKWYAKFLDRHQKVNSVISVSPVGKGSSLQGLTDVIRAFGFEKPLVDLVQQYCVACIQLVEGSELMQELYEDGYDTVPGVRYLNIATRKDQIVTPYTNGLIDFKAFQRHITHDSSDPSVAKAVQDSKNLVIEDYCDKDPAYTNHFGLFRSPFAFHAIDAFLSPQYHDGVLSCTLS
ncbi:hypothetical protein BG011_002468 [Mortierella polycephala]|uniref:Triacylglycerol lipase n=1 Tax=Mortierella polycephala TaxID=41804 RepID=A0A9P6UAK0_9FUNG|nr:hypothetical protein BG011_002468 [Mortierella polycephala]